MKWTLTIDDFITPSANLFMRMHWRERAKEALNWYWLLVKAGLNDVADATGPRRVRIWRESTGGPSKVEIDKLNATLAVDKCILDALVKQKKLIDDDPAHCDVEVIPVLRDRKRMVIEIEEIK
jgi:hypothetical protein